MVVDSPIPRRTAILLILIGLVCAALPVLSPGQAAAATSQVGAYVPVPQQRLYDAELGPRGSASIPVTGSAGLPSSGIAAVVLNVTGVAPTAAGYLTVWPGAVSKPLVASVNLSPNETRSNTVTVPVGSNGAVQAYNNAGVTRTRLDVVGYYAAAESVGGTALGLHLITPHRVFDSRTSSALQAGQARTVTVDLASLGSDLAVPAAQIEALAVNVTATDAAATGTLTVWDGSGSKPTTPLLTFFPGRALANTTVVPLRSTSTGSGFSLTEDSAGTVQAIVDVVGVYASTTLPGGLRYRAVTPERIIDSRNDTGGAEAWTPSLKTQTFAPSPTLVGDQTRALVANITAVGPTASTFVTVWGSGPRPSTSSLNAIAGGAQGNGVLIPAQAGQRFSIYNNSGTTDVTVDVGGAFDLPPAEPVLTKLTLTPATVAIPVGATSSLKATATYDDGTTIDVTLRADWSVGDQTLAGVDTAGQVTARAQGTTTVSAGFGGSVATSTLQIGPAQLTTLQPNPAAVSVPSGSRLNGPGGEQSPPNDLVITVTAVYSDGRRVDVTKQVAWTSSNATVFGVQPDGTLLAKAVGTATLTAAYGGMRTEVAATVTAAEVRRLESTPAAIDLPRGATANPRLTAYLSDGTSVAVADAGVWTSANTTIATVTDTGTVTGRAVGSTTLSGRYGGQSLTIPVRVSAAVVTSVRVTPTDPTIVRGQTRQLSATAVLSDGTTQDVTSTAVWSSSRSDIAGVSSAGLATARAAGTTQVTASYGGQTSTAITITVPAVTVSSIAISGPTGVLATGSVRQYTATATYSDGTTAEVTTQATWSSSASAVAAISAPGQVTGQQAGTTTVTATLAGVSSNGLALAVGAKSVTSIAITPTDAGVAVGATTQLSATATYSDGTTADVTATAGWSTDNPGIGTVDARGTVTGVAAGPLGVSAVLGSARQSVTVQVSEVSEDRMERALRTGDPDIVSENELLAQLPKSASTETALAAQLLGGSAISWAPGKYGAYVKAVKSPGLETLLTGNASSEANANGSGKVMAVAGTAGSANTRVAYFSSNPLVLADGSVQNDTGMNDVDLKTIGWLLGGVDPATTKANIVVANVYADGDAGTLAWLRAKMPQATINGGRSGSDACDFKPTSTCTGDKVDLIVAGTDLASSTGSAVAAGLKAAHESGVPLLHFEDDGTTWDGVLAGTSAYLGFDFYLSYWDQPALKNATRASQLPGSGDQLSADAAAIVKRLGTTPPTTNELDACAVQPSPYGSILAKCLTNPPASIADFTGALQRVRDKIAALDAGNRSIFALPRNRQGDSLRVLALLADKQRTGRDPSTRSDETAKAISYPVARTDLSAITHAWFADALVNLSWSGNGKAADLGTTYCLHADLAAGRCAAPTFPDAGAHSLTVKATAYDQWTATGFDLQPGVGATMTLTASPGAAVWVRTFGQPETTVRSWEAGWYDAPQWTTSNWVRLDPNQKVSITSPYGGPLALRIEGSDAVSGRSATVAFTGVGTHPVLRGPSTDAELAAFAAQLNSTTAFYADLTGAGYEVHVPVAKLKGTLGVTFGYWSNGGRDHSYVGTAGLRQLVTNYEDAWAAQSLRLAGLRAGDTSLANQLSSQVKSVCAAYGWPCGDETINKPRPVQHVIYTDRAACGDLCSGNPITSARANPDPLDYLIYHELGHNLQLNPMQLYYVDTANGSQPNQANSWANYSKRTTEVSNEFWGIYGQWRYWRILQPAANGQTADTASLRYYTEATPYLGMYALQQSAASGLTKSGSKVALNPDCSVKASFPSSATAQSVVADAVWKDSAAYANSFLKLSTYTAIPILLDNKTMADGTVLSEGDQIWTLLNLASRGFSSVATSESSWNANRAAYGFTRYAFTDDAHYGTGKNVGTMIGNDFLVVVLSKISGYDFRPYFTSRGLSFTDLASAQVGANAPAAGLKALPAAVVLGNQQPLRDLAGTATLSSITAGTTWPGTDDDANGTKETKVGWSPAQCAGVTSNSAAAQAVAARVNQRIAAPEAPNSTPVGPNGEKLIVLAEPPVQHSSGRETARLVVPPR